MENSRIARILYNMHLDLGYADGIEYAEEEIECIAKEIKVLQDNQCDSLLNVLEMIALQNEKMEFWKESVHHD